MTNLTYRILVATLGASLAGIAGAQTSINGLRGSEWSGVAAKRVQYSPTANANPSAFQDKSDTAALDVLSRTDGTYFYGLIQTVTAGLGNDNADATLATQFANVYFDADLPNDNGSDLAFELGNNRVYSFDTNQYYDNISNFGVRSAFTTGTSYANGGQPSTYEFAIPLSYFTNDPQNIGFVKTVPGQDVQFRSLQAYGYAFVGSTGTFGATRFGQFPTQAVPEPASLAALGLGAVGLLRRRKSAK